MSASARIMVVEDEGIVALNLSQRLGNLGYQVPGIAASCEEALALAEASHPDLVLMDIRIRGEVDGIDTAARLVERHGTPVVFLTAYSEDSTLERARATRPYGYLLKPFSEREMHATIQMALTRREAERAVAISEQRLRLAMEAAVMGAWELDLSNREVDLIGRAARLFGMHGEAEHLHWDDLLAHLDAADRARIVDTLESDLHAVGRAAVEFHLAGRGDDTGWLRLLARRLDDGAGTSRVIGVIQDVSDTHVAWKRIEELNDGLEKRVAARTSELEEALAELDAFNYSVAHDLRAPVRAVISFASIVLEEHGAALPAEARAGLERVVLAGRRMGELIDALLGLARIKRAPLEREDVDVSALAGEVVAVLRAEFPHRVVSVDIQAGMFARADPRLLRVVLENLLRNAWKFTSRHVSARVEVGRRASAGGTEFYVRDDGAGFAREAAGKLFGLFGRLHGGAEFEGIGIGLVTVQRIVRRHGGAIRGEGEREKGAAFYFTLGDAA